jgi:hypothetical protein
MIVNAGGFVIGRRHDTQDMAVITGAVAPVEVRDVFSSWAQVVADFTASLSSRY